MSTFYLLPPRKTVEQRYAEFLSTIVPDMNYDGGELLADLEELASSRDCCLVFRDDLPADGADFESLQDWFGAAEQDRVIDIEMTNGAREPEA